MTITEYIDTKTGLMSNTTLKSEASRLRNNIDLRNHTINEMVQILLKRYKRNTAKQVYIRLKCFLDHRQHDFDVFEKQNPQIWRFEYIGRDQLPTIADINKWSFYGQSDRIVAMSIILMSHVGLRWNELFNLKPDHIQPDCDTSLTKFTIIQGKGRKDRIVYTPYLDISPAQLPFNITSGQLRYLWKKYKVPFTPHSLRSYWITQLARKTANVKLIAELAGHNSIETTMKYIKILDEDKKALVLNV